MNNNKTIQVVAWHAEGGVGNVIVAGVDIPPGKTRWEQARWLHED